MVGARPDVTSRSGRPSYADRFASRRRMHSRAAAMKEEQGVQTDDATEGHEEKPRSALESSFSRHRHNLQKCKELQDMNLERHAMGAPLVDLWAEFEQICASGMVLGGHQGQLEDLGQRQFRPKDGQQDVASGDEVRMQLVIIRDHDDHDQPEMTPHNVKAERILYSLVESGKEGPIEKDQRPKARNEDGLSPERQSVDKLADCFIVNNHHSCAPVSRRMSDNQCNDKMPMEDSKTEPAETSWIRNPLSCIHNEAIDSALHPARADPQLEVESTAPTPSSQRARSLRKDNAAWQHQSRCRLQGCAAARFAGGRRLTKRGCCIEGPTNCSDASRKFRDKYLALVCGTHAAPAPGREAKSVKAPQAYASRQAKVVKGWRFLRAIVQRRGLSRHVLETDSRSELDGCRAALPFNGSWVRNLGKQVTGRKPDFVLKLHRFAWGGAADTVEAKQKSTAICSTDILLHDDLGTVQSAEAGSDALSQYLSAFPGCPVVLRPLNGRSNGLIGRIVRRFLMTWYGNATFGLVAIGFRSIRLILTYFAKWKNLVFVRVSLQRLYGGRRDATPLRNLAYANLLPNIVLPSRGLSGSVHGWSSMQNTILKLTLVAYDASLGLSAEDQMLLKISVLACKLRWTSTAVQHLGAWAAWLKHPWRLIRFRCNRRVRDEYLAEWRARSQGDREERARGAMQLWKKEVRRICDIAAYGKQYACMRRQRYQASFFDVLVCDVARKRASGLLAKIPRQLTHSWLLSKWRLRSAMVHRAATFAAMKSCRLLHTVWEEWSLAGWARLRHLAILFGAWSAYVYSDLMQRKRSCKAACIMLFSRQSRRRIRRCLAKWRLLAAVSCYAINLALAARLRSWYLVVQDSSQVHRHVRKIYRARFTRKMLCKWLETTVHVARHRSWKAQVRAAHRARIMQTLREACSRQCKRRRHKQNAMQTAAAHHAHLLSRHRLPRFVLLWAVQSKRGRHVQRIRVQMDVRLKGRILVLFARSVCLKYMILKCLRSHLAEVLAAWREKCATTKWFERKSCAVRSRAKATQKRMVISFLAFMASRRKALSMSAKAISTKCDKRHTSRGFRCWQAAAARKAMFDLAQEYFVDERRRRRLQGFFTDLAEHCVFRCAKRTWSRKNAAAEARRSSVLCKDIFIDWHEFAQDSRRQAALYHACKQACMQELIRRTARSQCATLQGVVLLLHHALSAWQAAAAKTVARRRLVSWQ